MIDDFGGPFQRINLVDMYILKVWLTYLVADLTKTRLANEKPYIWSFGDFMRGYHLILFFAASFNSTSTPTTTSTWNSLPSKFAASGKLLSRAMLRMDEKRRYVVALLSQFCLSAAVDRLCHVQDIIWITNKSYSKLI